MWKRFPKPSTFKSLYYKSIVRGNLTGIKLDSPHGPSFNAPEKDYYKACNSIGENIELNDEGFLQKNSVTYDGAVVMHYRFRSTEEFCFKITKRKRFEFFRYTNQSFKTIFVNVYFKHNIITKEKIHLIEKCLGDKIDKKFKRNINRSTK